MKSPNCEEKTSLLVAYQAAAEMYSRAVSELARNIGKVHKAEYQRLHLAAEQTRLAAKEARSALDAHLYEHCCDKSIDVSSC